MEQRLVDVIKRLGILLVQKEALETEERELLAKIANIIPSGEPTRQKQASAPTIPAAAPSPRKEQPAGDNGEPRPKSPIRAKQGQYMGLVKHLSENDKRLVAAAKESSGIDDAIILAKKLGATKPKVEADPFEETTDTGTQDTFEEQFTDI